MRPPIPARRARQLARRLDGLLLQPARHTAAAAAAAVLRATAGGRALAASFVGNEAFLVYDGDEEGADVAAKRARA